MTIIAKMTVIPITSPIIRPICYNYYNNIIMGIKVGKSIMADLIEILPYLTIVLILISTCNHLYIKK